MAYDNASDETAASAECLTRRIGHLEERADLGDWCDRVGAVLIARRSVFLRGTGIHPIFEFL
jgi:hypothetical protein